MKHAKNPYLCAFSCYLWNFEYNKALAKEIREQFPGCKIVFGGHQISRELVRRELDAGAEWVRAVDVFVYDEGEIVFRDLLKHLAFDQSLEDIPNLSFDDAGQYVFTPKAVMEQADYPSPYLSGIFDGIVDGKAGHGFAASLETNRGCPYGCAYCDWGIYEGRLRKFPMERVKQEIEWFSRHKIDHIYGTDANFGIFERDEEVVDCLIKQKEYGGVSEQVSSMLRQELR